MGVALPAAVDAPDAPDEPLNELEALAGTLGFEVVHSIMQTRHAPDTRTYIGKGKIQELQHFIARHDVDHIMFDNDLSPKQSQVLEQELSCSVWDRTQVILEIFARHARTAEAKVQVELASLKYLLPRLVGLWGHLDREKGGISASRGMGEKQVAIDRRIVRNRISKLEKSLQKFVSERQVRKNGRKNFFQVVLVGYTNAGKSTLMNLLTGSRLPAEDQLFATLDSTTRRIKGVTKPDVLVSDTVGFIRSLPHGLIASFHSTLDVVREADLLLHVVDVSHPDMEQHITTTNGVLEELGATDIPRLVVFNKTDRYHDDIGRIIIEKRHAPCVFVSALAPASGELMCGKIRECLQRHFFSRIIKLPYSKCDSLAELYAYSIVDDIDYKEDAIYVNCTFSQAQKTRFAELI